MTGRDLELDHALIQELLLEIAENQRIIMTILGNHASLGDRAAVQIGLTNMEVILECLKAKIADIENETRPDSTETSNG